MRQQCTPNIVVKEQGRFFGLEIVRCIYYTIRRRDSSCRHLTWIRMVNLIVDSSKRLSFIFTLILYFYILNSIVGIICDIHYLLGFSRKKKMYSPCLHPGFPVEFAMTLWKSFTLSIDPNQLSPPHPLKFTFFLKLWHTPWNFSHFYSTLWNFP